MDEAKAPLTEFLLDLTENGDIYERFRSESDALIAERGLEEYGDILKDGDVPALRAAVRAEVAPGSGPGPVPGIRTTESILEQIYDEVEEVLGLDPIIAGIRGIRIPPPPDEPVPEAEKPPPDGSTAA